MIIKHIGIFLIYLVVSTLMTPKVFAEITLSDESYQVVNWQTKEEFFTNLDGFRQFGVTIEVPNAASGSEVVSENGSVILNNEKTIWHFSSFEDSLTYTTDTGLSKKIIAQWKPLKNSIIIEQCLKNSARVRLQNEKSPLSFPVAVSCDNSQKTLNITLSVPAQVEWMDSTLFEVAGKGEPWRSYNLPATSPKGGVIGTITLKNLNQEYVIEIITPKNIDLVKKEALEKQKKKQSSEFQQAIYLGKMDLNYSADPVTADESKYFVKYSLLSPKIFGFLKWGGEFKTSFATSQKDEAIDLISYNGLIGYHYDYKNQLDFGVRALFSGFTVQQKSSTAKLSSNQAGYGLYVDYLFDSRNRVLAKFNMISMMSSVVKSHLEYGVEYRYQIKYSDKPFWFGLGYNSETYKAENNIGLGREFKDSELQFMVGF